MAELWIVRWLRRERGEACAELRLREAMTHDGRMLRTSTLNRRIHPGVPGYPGGEKAREVRAIEALADVMLFRGIPENIRWTMVRSSWRRSCGHGWAKWAPGRCTSSREVLGRTVISRVSPENWRRMLERGNSDPLKEAHIAIENWCVEYNTKCPHWALGYRPPAPVACSPWNNRSSQPMAAI